MMQWSLGGRPHRSDRSQSAHVKSGRRRSAATVLANLAKTPWNAVRMAVLLRGQIIDREEPRRFDKYQFSAQSGP
jgi:hypothetical protein